jgi:hypothetical protein
MEERMNGSTASLRSIRGPRASRRSLRLLGFVAALLFVGGCDGQGFGVGIGGGGASQLRSGLYEYDAWSDRYRDLAWWGTFDLRVHSDGALTGTYRLPRQCSDRYGPGADCFGRIGGRVHRDGTVRLGLDEGWISHDGYVSRRSLIRGSWWTRLLGASDEGTFELRAF